jgi:hypothetical protein
MSVRSVYIYCCMWMELLAPDLHVAESRGDQVRYVKIGAGRAPLFLR